jgi:FKBP-type peptidyl-prolyl cis-trans isomerase
MKKNIFSGIIVFLTVFTFFACEKENVYIKSRKLELEKLDEYIAKNYPDVDPKPSGLYVIETQQGFGDTIKVGDKVHIFYLTMTLDSTIIDESSGYSLGQRYEPYEVIVGTGNSINGLEEGLTYLRPGSKANLVINSELAYGQTGSYSIGGFTTLLMEIEVYKVFPRK